MTKEDIDYYRREISENSTEKELNDAISKIMRDTRNAQKKEFKDMTAEHYNKTSGKSTKLQDTTSSITDINLQFKGAFSSELVGGSELLEDWFTTEDMFDNVLMINDFETLFDHIDKENPSDTNAD